MCSLAPPTALGLDFHDARAPLGRRRRVAPAACGAMAREPVRRAGAAVSFAAPTQKRSREAPAPVAPALGQQRRLQERMREELDAIRVLHKKAMLLSRGAIAASRSKDAAAAGARSAAPMQAAAKMTKTLPLKRAPEAAALQSMETVKQHQKRPVVQRATPSPTMSSAAEPLDKAREILKRRRLEEIARARESCRQEVLEMERTALPDETIHPRDLLELGIAFEYAVTRTWRQAHG
ncbi:unnamed protein product [Urochloa humidicola]